VVTTASTGIVRPLSSARPLGPRLFRDPAAEFCARVTSALPPWPPWHHVGLAKLLPPPGKDAC
jgi:hypothetical protein